MPNLISVIVVTYNRPDALDAVLRALSVQRDGGFEVVLADDGSKPETAAVAAAWNARLGRRVLHVWQPDCGFRAAEIRNRAILAANGDYCVFLDGDCLVRPDFVAAHRKLAEPRWFVTGNRALMSPELSDHVLREHLPVERWTTAQWLHQRSRGGINRLAALLKLPLGPLRSWHAASWRGARSCNLGVWRSDLVAVNGFDAAFIGWGREDSDLFVRLMRSGVRRKDGRMATGVLHLWHPTADRASLPENDQRLADALADTRIAAKQGLSALSDEPKIAASVN